MSVTERRIGLLRKLSYTLFTTALILIAVEVVARALGYGQRVVAVPDERVGFRLLPSQDRTTPRGQHISINSHGMRDEEFPKAKPKGEYRVLLLGDSLTFGIDVEQDEIFARRVAISLREKSKGAIRLMNGAVQGYDTSNERDWLRTFGFDLAPDLVVVMFYPNDIEFTERKFHLLEFPGRDLLRLTATFEWMESKYLESESQRLGMSGEANDLKARQWKELIAKYKGGAAMNPDDPKDKQGTIVARGILIEMAIECAKRNIKFGVAMIPAFANTRDPKLPNIMGGLSYDLKNATIPHVNLLEPLVPHHPACWLEWDEGHLSSLGHEKLAVALEDWLISTGFLPLER